MAYNSIPPVGQDDMAGSLPVVLASDQTDVKITLDGESVVIASSGLPAGASTSALQTTGNTSLATLAGAVAGTEVQVDVLTSALPTGAAIAANQQTDALTDTQLRATPVPVSGTVTANLAAGTNNIGDVDILSIAAGDNNIGNVDIVTMPAITATDLDIRNLTFATDKVDASGSTGVGVTGTFWQATQPVSGTVSTIAAGDVAHDTADSGNPVKIGAVAVSGSASPTSVASGDRTRLIANQHGIPYFVGGHPNIITREYDFGTAAQTDINLAAAAVAADERIYITRFEAMCDNANTVNVSVRAGFGTANVPAASATGVSGMIASHPGVAPGSGFISGNGVGILAVGGAGEEPRLTSSVATTGNLHVLISYFLIDETP